MLGRALLAAACFQAENAVFRPRNSITETIDFFNLIQTIAPEPLRANGRKGAFDRHQDALKLRKAQASKCIRPRVGWMVIGTTRAQFRDRQMKQPNGG